MINLETDDGMRDAFKAIAAWEAPAGEEPVDAPDRVLIPLSPRNTRPKRRPVLLVGAAVLMVVVIGAALLARAPADQIPAAEGSWTPMASSPLEARFDPISLWTGTELLVWGGHDAAGEEYVDGAAYDPERDQWRKIADFPFDYERRTGSGVGSDSGWYQRHGVPGAWFDGKAVFKVDTGEEPWSWDLVAYDPDSDSWRTLHRARFDRSAGDTPVRPPGTSTVQAPTGLAAVGGKLFVFGWHTDRNELGWSTFDPEVERWSAFSGIPGSGEVDGFTGVRPEPVLVADRYLVWLREHGIVADGFPLGYAVDLTTEDVVRVEVPADVPAGTIDLQLGDLSTSGSVAGTTLSDDLDGEPFAAQLDAATGRWTALKPPPDMGAADAFGRIVSANGATFIVGGLDQKGSGHAPSGAGFVMDRQPTLWHRMPDAPIDLSRTGHVAIWTGDELLVWGGATTPDGDDPRATIPLADGAIYRFERDGP